MIGKRVEETCPLSPMQLGMLSNSLFTSESGVDVVQVVASFAEDLDAERFADAWARILDRHPVLRTAFRWDDGQPVQVIHPTVRLPWEQRDWRDLAPEEAESRLVAYLDTDRRRGFRLGEAPLIRLALFQTGTDRWRFVLTFHHSVLDGRSLLVLFNEVFAVSDALRLGRPPALPDAPPFTDYVRWLHAGQRPGDEPFWRDQLEGFATPTPLLPEPEPERLTSFEEAHGEHDTVLDAGRSGELRQFVLDHGLTLGTVIRGAWGLLLARSSGQTDVVFGETRACRRGTVAGSDAIVGPMLNTLPVRVRITGSEDVLSWLRDLRGQTLAARGHEHASLMQVQGWTGVRRGRALFDSLVSFENLQLHTALRRQGGAWERREFALRRQPNFPLVLMAFGDPDIVLKLLYDGRRFSPPTAARLGDCLSALLTGLVAGATRRLWQLGLAGEAERRKLDGWNATQGDYPADACIHRLVEGVAELRPDSLAVRRGAHDWTYRQLDERANQIAHLLRRHGAGPETRVGVRMRRSAELVAAELGVLKAGAAYVAIDPGSPPERAAFMLSDAGARVLLTHREVTALPVPAGVTAVDVDGDPNPLSAFDVRNPPAAGMPANLAHVMYTSGSTGRPKGVESQHRGVVNLMTWYRRTFELGPGDRMVLAGSPGFDGTVLEIWPCLGAGASLHVPDDDVVLDTDRLAAWLRDEGITVAFLTTALAEPLLARPWPADSKLRALLVGGERLHRVAQPELPFQLCNVYGPTENSALTTGGPVRVGPDGDAVPPIGRPLLNNRVHLVDRWYEPMPAGVPGEVCIGGDGLARGYLNDPGLTAERFVPNPFGRRPGERMYRTGDLGRHRSDGAIEFVGRIDDQVKVRGFRIEPGEIEATLRLHPAVSAAAVTGAETGGRERSLTAYVVLREGDAAPSATDLRAALRDRLPDYMLPATIVALPELPLNPNGKVDRRALAAAAPLGLGGGRYVAPSTPLEELLVGIWRDVLGAEQLATEAPIGVDDDFFELGGHSLMAVKVMLRVSETLGADLPSRVLFEDPTVAALAARVRQALGRDGGEMTTGADQLRSTATNRSSEE